MSYELKKFEYVICDLPEMIVHAHKQITNKYLTVCKGNYDVFLPNELEEFYKSKSDRKVLFILPDQLDKKILKVDKKFDLFINHESFAEMKIETVNTYLEHLPSLMKKGGIVNIVNRHTRPQAKSYQDFKHININEITCFNDYKLDFCEILFQDIDRFRARIPVQQETPNIFFIGRVK